MNNIFTLFPGGKFKAVTLSYDDGTKEDERLVDIFNKYNLKCTFNLNGKKINDSGLPTSFYKDLYKGHEVACHSLTHPVLTHCPREQVVQELVEDRKVLENTMDTLVRGFAYPFGAYNSELENTLNMVGLQYARTVNSTKYFNLPNRYTEWHPTCHHNDNLINVTNQFLNLNETHFALLYVWGHSYEFENDNNWELIEQFSELIGNNSNIWYATNIEIFDYFQAAKQLQYSMNLDRVYNPFSFSIWLYVNNNVVEVKGGETKILN